MLARCGRQWHVAILVALVASVAFAFPAGAVTGYKTSKPSQVTMLASGWSAEPLLTVGDTLGNYQMAATPDGLGAYDNGDGTYTLLMNHELTTQDEESTGGKFGGVSLAIDAKTGTVTNLPWLGHLSHENTLVAPGFPGKTVVFTTDDNAPGGVYIFVANSPSDLLAGKGQLYALSVDGTPSEADLLKGKSYTGKWVALTGDDNKDVKTLRAAMEKKGATIFARPEDATYDRTDPSAIFFATTGRSGYKDAAGKEVNAKGKIHRVKMDPSDPTKITEFRVVLDGNGGDDILNPDNLEADRSGLMIQEDLNSEFRTRPGRLLRYEYASGKLTPILQLNQRDFNGQPLPDDKPGEWESSGVIDVSAILGPNTWLFDVQAHTLKTPQFGGSDEGGQLLVLRFGAAPSAAPSVAPSVAPSAAPSPTPSGAPMPGLPNTGGGGASGDRGLAWMLVLLVPALAAAFVAGRRRMGAKAGR